MIYFVRPTVQVEDFYREQQAGELEKIKNSKAFVALGAGILISNRTKRRNITLRIQKQKENVLEILRRLFADFERMRTLYKEYDGISEKILEEYARL